MKIGIISDIHSNPYGLETVLKRLKYESVDLILCAGDLTGYSPLVNETLEIIIGEKIECIIGNHDYYLLNECPYTKNDIVKNSVFLTKKLIKVEFINFIKKLKTIKDLNIDGVKIKMIHGGPFNRLEQYVYPDHIINPKEFCFDSEGTLILGHTHHQMIKKIDDFYILNPGSCGQPRDGKGEACYALFDTLNKQVELKRVKYDTAEMINTLIKQDWPSQLLNYF